MLGHLNWLHELDGILTEDLMVGTFETLAQIECDPYRLLLNKQTKNKQTNKHPYRLLHIGRLKHNTALSELRRKCFFENFVKFANLKFLSNLQIEHFVKPFVCEL